jgi:UDP-2,3-diacylglucosamine pyrophosphatase LpxH
VDDDLVKLIGHYRRTPPSGERWRMIIAGDFIDFIGMTILRSHEPVATEPSEEEREHGLGNAADHARIKLLRVVARHEAVFDALAAFVADGHALTLVHGNHDVEFHWDDVKDKLRSVLLERARATMDARAFVERIEFHPWFYYVGGIAYVEHGHQYDALCATDHVMAPLSPLDPRRIARGFSDIFLRFVVRPTRGLPEYGHERLGLVDYIAFGARLGLRGLVSLVVRFFSAVRELLRLNRAYFGETAKTLRAEHERRMALLAEATRIGIDKLRALSALQVPPVQRSIRGILASVLLDRLALALGSAIALAVVALIAIGHPLSWFAAAGVGVAWFAAHRHLMARRRAIFGEKLDNDETLVDRAGHLAHLFPAAFVVMGHTHSPTMVPVAEGAATYVNVGSWAEGEEDAGRPEHRAARTHLVIHPPAASGRPVAEFLAWSADGPQRFPRPG